MSVRNHCKSKFASEADFERAWDRYKKIEPFAADSNIFESDSYIDEPTLKVLRAATEYYLTKAFKAMKINLDENTMETPKRIAKVWCGDSLSCDTELGGGRFSKPVRIPHFPNTRGNHQWITKKVRLISTCSHHFLPFTGEAVISYKPNKYVLGISKLQRLTNYVANRFWLQEDLTREIHKKIVEAADVTDADVKVTIEAKHGCEMHRGVKNQDCEFITEE